MNIWNTIAAEPDTAASKAIFTLQALSDPHSVPILDYLLEHGEATLLDLMIATELDSETLEMQLERLCQTRVVQWHSNIYSSHYELDYQQLNRVQDIARQLVKR